jgi:hypothetical protein
MMDLIPNSGLNPVADRLLVQLEYCGDLSDGHELIARETRRSSLRVLHQKPVGLNPSSGAGTCDEGALWSGVASFGFDRNSGRHSSG